MPRRFRLPSGACKPFGPTVTADGETPKNMCLGYADWWTEAFYDGIVRAKEHGGLFTTSYSHGWSPAETAQKMGEIMKAKPELFPARTDIVALLCEKLHVAGLRLADADRWASGKVFSNHSKFLMVDEKAFYIGSQNLYVSDLAEFGYIVDSARDEGRAGRVLGSPLEVLAALRRVGQRSEDLRAQSLRNPNRREISRPRAYAVRRG